MRHSLHALKKTFPIIMLLLCGAASALLYMRFRTLQVPLSPEATTSLMQNFVAITALLFIAFLGAVLSLKKIIRTNALATKSSLIMVIGFAALFRFSLLSQTPWLSNDIYRYLWDARVLEHGINPYKYPPEANALLQLRDEELFAKMSHKDVRTVYPPLLQGLFWLGAKSGQVFAIHPMLALKSLFVLFDLLLLLMLVRTLLQSHLDARWVLLYAWHPLAIIEIASSGHTDGVGTFFLLAALFLFMRDRYALGAISLAFAFIVKFISVLLLPFVFFFGKRQGGKNLNWAAMLAFTVTVVVSYLPFIAAGENLFSGLSVYSAKWRFNDAIFSILFEPLHAMIPDSVVIHLMIPSGWEITAEVLRTRRIDLVLQLAKAIMATVFAYVYWRIWKNIWERRTALARMSWHETTLAILTAFLLLSPTLQPWYLLWILPLLCLTFAAMQNPQRQIAGQLQERMMTTEFDMTKPARLMHIFLRRFPAYLWILSGAVFLSYWVLRANWRDGVWQEQAWVKWVEFGLPALIFFVPIGYRRFGKSE